MAGARTVITGSPGKIGVPSGIAQMSPWKRKSFPAHGLDVLRLGVRQPVAEVAAVHLVPALVHAVLGDLHEALRAGHV